MRNSQLCVGTASPLPGASRRSVETSPFYKLGGFYKNVLERHEMYTVHRR
jgi:hypothetical protein